MTLSVSLRSTCPAGTSRATGLPLRVMTTSRPCETLSSSADKWVFAANAPTLRVFPRDSSNQFIQLVYAIRIHFGPRPQETAGPMNVIIVLL